MEDLEIKKDEDYAMRSQTAEEKERLNSEEDIPQYRIAIKLDDDQKKRLIEQAFLEFDALVTERTQNKIEEKWKERDAQYDGDLKPNKTLQFNLHIHESKIKVDKIVSDAKEAFLPDDGRIVDVSPRPESARKDGHMIAEKQAEFLDYAMDEEIKPESSLEKILKCSAKKFVGIGKLCWSYRREKRKREETYEGKNVAISMVGGKMVMDNEALRQFLSAYPEAAEKQKGYVKRLLEEKKVEIVVEYKDTINNNPELKYVKIEDFFVRNGCNYWEGLKTEHCVVERETYTYWELLKKQDQGEFENIEALWQTDDAKEDGKAKDYMTCDYKVLEFTTYFKINENDDEEVKIKFWAAEEKKHFLGAILFPYYAFDIDYIPWYMVTNEYGFYGDARSIMYDVKDNNIAQDVLLNMALYALYLRNCPTPIATEGSEIVDLFLEKKWEPGVPLVLDGLIDDVNKGVKFIEWPTIDMNSFAMLSEMLRRNGGDVTRVNDLTTGNASQLDPNAPAAKTLALLAESGKGIKDYVKTLLPSFNIFCEMVLQLYYQMSQEGRKYKIRRKAESVTGSDPFSTLSRDEMVIKTNIQARAAAFVFDKMREKQEALVGLQLVKSDPFAIQQPNIQYEAFKIALSTLGGRWKNLVEKMPSPEEFSNKQMQVAVQAMKMLLQSAMQQKETTGVAPELTPEIAGQAVTTAQSVDYNPALAQPAEK